MPRTDSSGITPVKMLVSPHFYENWLPWRELSLDLLKSEFSQTHFNCGDCEMAKIPLRGRTRDLGPFQPSLKCCTFSPFLPSFTLGELLLQVDQERFTNPPFVLEERLESYLKTVSLCPLGAIPKRAPTSVCETGKDPSDRCEFLEHSGNPKCTIFDMRPSPCVSYVCSAKGHEDAVEDFFSHWRRWGERAKEFEWTLAHLVAFEAGYTQDDVRVQFESRDEALSYFRVARTLAETLQAW